MKIKSVIIHTVQKSGWEAEKKIFIGGIAGSYVVRLQLTRPATLKTGYKRRYDVQLRKRPDHKSRPN